MIHARFNSARTVYLQKTDIPDQYSLICFWKRYGHWTRAHQYVSSQEAKVFLRDFTLVKVDTYWGSPSAKYVRKQGSK